MSEGSPLVEAQEQFSNAVPFGTLPSETITLDQALNRVLAEDLLAPGDSPPYPRAIVEGFVVASGETRAATEENPLTFKVTGSVSPGDEKCPIPGALEAIEIATGSIVPEGKFSIVRMWDAEIGDKQFSIKRSFAPHFFIEEQGCDIKKGDLILKQGHQIDAADIGTIASLGIRQIRVVALPKVAIFASGDEVIPYAEPLKPGQIRDCNTPMLSAAIQSAGGIAHAQGIMNDDFDAFVTTLKKVLSSHDMVVISGGTAVGGRDFISDLLKTTGELIVDGVPMRSGRPLIMGIADNKPVVCVAGHPPEALRGFKLFGIPALNRIQGIGVPLPVDDAKPQGGPPK